MKQVCESLFRAIGFCFSAALMVLSLLTSIKLAAVNETAAQLERAVEQLKEENEIRRAAYENSVSLEEIERYAVEELGMQRCAPNQVFVLYWDESVEESP